MVKIAIIVLVVGLLFGAVTYYESYYVQQIIPDDPPEKFIEELSVGNYDFYEPSNLYYTKLENGYILATGGENAEENIKIEIEARR